MSEMLGKELKEGFERLSKDIEKTQHVSALMAHELKTMLTWSQQFIGWIYSKDKQLERIAELEKKLEESYEEDGCRYCGSGLEWKRRFENYVKSKDECVDCVFGMRKECVHK